MDERTLDVDGFDELSFLRDYVGNSRPVVINGMIDDWPALSKWQDDEYLCSALGDTLVPVNYSPNGRADSIVKLFTPSNQPSSSAASTKSELVFAKPCEEQVSFRKFFSSLQNEVVEGSTEVPYLSQQCDCFRQKFPQLLPDILRKKASNANSHSRFQSRLARFGAAVFGNQPDAVNLWIGDSRSVTTAHKDHYENL